MKRVLRWVHRFLTPPYGFEARVLVRQAAPAPPETLYIDVVTMGSSAELVPQGTIGLVENWSPAKAGSPPLDDIFWVAWARRGGGGCAEPVKRRNLEFQGRARLHPTGGER